MGWLQDNSLKCETCENVLKAYTNTKAEMADLAVVSRWGLYTGETIGGQSFITVSCRTCREGSHRRIIKKIPGNTQVNLWGDAHD